MLLSKFNEVFAELELIRPGIVRLIDAGISYPATYYPVEIDVDGECFEMLRLSIFDISYDDIEDVIQVNYDDFDINKVFYFYFVCLNLVNLIIQIDSRATYIMEPGKDAKKHILTKLKIQSDKQLKSALSKGQVAEILGLGLKSVGDNKKIREIQRENKELKKNLKYSKDQEKLIKEKQDIISKLEGEKSHIEDRLRVANIQLIEARQRAWLAENPGLK